MEYQVLSRAKDLGKADKLACEKDITHTLHLSPKAIFHLNPPTPQHSSSQNCCFHSSLVFQFPRNYYLFFLACLHVSYSPHPCQSLLVIHSILCYDLCLLQLPFVFISGEPNQINRYSQYPLFPMELLAALIVTFARQIKCFSLSLSLHFFRNHKHSVFRMNY